MRSHRSLFFAAVVSTIINNLLQAQQTQQSGSLQASNLLNPNVSVIGWFQSEAGHRKVDPEAEEEDAAFALKEAELAFQAVVDPYAKAEFFIGVHPEEIELEEGYINWHSLPYGLAAKAGKFRANFGKFNRIHTPETAFADRPLVHENYFGEEGLSGPGASFSWRIPTDKIFLNLDADVFGTPEREEAPAFDKAEKKDLTYVARLGNYFDVSESANVTFGTSFAHGAAGQEFDAVENSSSTLDSRLVGFDLTFRWKNPRRAIYRSLLSTTEVLWSRQEVAANSHVNTFGMFSHLEYQFARRWKTGVRYDYTEKPLDDEIKERGGLVYLTFMPTEFSLISLQGRHVKQSDDIEETLGFLKVTFNIGPHGAHPF